MFDQTILDEIRTRETARIDKVMHETSPAEVLRRLEREQADYLSYVAGTTDAGRTARYWTPWHARPRGRPSWHWRYWLAATPPA